MSGQPGSLCSQGMCVADDDKGVVVGSLICAVDCVQGSLESTES
jgi:hypothetical protein